MLFKSDEEKVYWLQDTFNTFLNCINNRKKKTFHRKAGCRVLSYASHMAHISLKKIFSVSFFFPFTLISFIFNAHTISRVLERCFCYFYYYCRCFFWQCRNITVVKNSEVAASVPTEILCSFILSDLTQSPWLLCMYSFFPLLHY